MRDFNQAFSIFLLGQGVNNCTPRQGPDKEGGEMPRGGTFGENKE